MSRKSARTWTVKALYEMDVKDEMEPSFVESYCSYHELSESESVFLAEQIGEFLAHRQEIDEAIRENIRQKDIRRLGRIDLAILREAITEMRYAGTPLSVVINEAVELAKEYGNEQSYAFINGVLGVIAKDNHHGQQTDGQ